MGTETKIEQIWMDKDGLLEPFSKRYFPREFGEHIAGRRSFVLPVRGVKCSDEDKLEGAWQKCIHIEQAVEPQSMDRLTVSWSEGRWSCKLVLDRTPGDGSWAVVHAETRSRDSDQSTAGVGMNAGAKDWLCNDLPCNAYS